MIPSGLTFCIVALADAVGWIRRGKEELADRNEQQGELANVGPTNRLLVIAQSVDLQ